MTKIKMTVGEYDDSEKILMRHALQVPDSIPLFFRLLNTDKIFPGKQTLDIEDFREVVKKKKEVRVNNIDFVLSEARAYGIPKTEALSIWYLTAKWPLTDATFAILQNYDKDFSVRRRLEKTVKDFTERIDRERKGIKEKLEKDDKLATKLKTTPEEELPRFNVEGEVFQFLVETSKYYDIVEIFYKMNSSKRIPFVVCKSEGNTFFKVWEDQIPPESWYREVEQYPPGLYFYVLAVESTLRREFIEKAYAKCVWSNQGFLTVEYKIRKSSLVKDKIVETIYGSLEKEGKQVSFSLEGLSLANQKPINVAGTFVSEMNFNPYVMAYLVSLHPLVKKVGFMNESENTEPQKVVFRLYLSLNQDAEVSKSLQFNISSAEKEIEVGNSNTYVVRIRHAKDVLAARVGIRLFYSVLKIYDEQYTRIIEAYKTNPAAYAEVEGTKKKVKESKKSKKTKDRLAALQAYDPNLFHSRYSDQCQSKGQPYIVAQATEDGSIPGEVTTLEKKLGPHKTMEFDGAYYACETPTDKREGYVYPRLKRNRDTATGDPLYREDYPCVPCCYKKYKELSEALTRDACLSDVERSADTAYVAENKDPDPERMSDVPRSLARLASLQGVKKIPIGKNQKMHYPYLRYGVEESPTSFIHCLEVATNSKVYTSSQKKGDLIDNAIKEMIATFQIGKQQFYDVFKGNLERELKRSPNSYLEPSLWIALAEAYYQVNIVLIQLDEEIIEGEFLYPRASEALLPKRFPDRGTVVIFRQFVKNGVWPYQCSVLKKMPEEEYVFEGDRYVDSLVDAYEKSWQVYSVSTKGHWEYSRDVITELEWVS